MDRQDVPWQCCCRIERRAGEMDVREWDGHTLFRKLGSEGRKDKTVGVQGVILLSARS